MHLRPRRSNFFANFSDILVGGIVLIVARRRRAVVYARRSRH